MPIAQSGGVTIHTSCSLSRFVRADLIAMRRIINNLISNAIKFTRRGGRIDIIAFDRDGRATVQVKDTGIGITSEEMEHLFERFWQAKSKYRAKGVGLGLYLCYQLLRELDGTIRCESTPGSGTMFEISMPYHEQSTEPSIMPIKKLSHGLAASVSREVAAEQHKRGLLASSG
jgi:signal transduction histidine kinase